MFGVECQSANKERVKDILQVANVADEEKYLGLPTPQGRMSKDKFTNRPRCSKQFTSWVEQYMLLGTKEVLIKFIALAIPTYAMGVFKLLATLC
jgi:hypothetical protein